MIKSLEPYNADWQAEYNKISNVLLSELGDLNVNIQHVGSTSIPGIYAKPILDIDVIISEKYLLGEITSRLEKIGYEYKGEQGIPGRFAYRQISSSTPLVSSNNNWQSHHLYVCYSDSLALKNHLLFRNALRTDKDLAERYSQLKKALIKDPGISVEQYTRTKTHFILSVLTTLDFNKAELREIREANL